MLIDRDLKERALELYCRGMYPDMKSATEAARQAREQERQKRAEANREKPAAVAAKIQVTD